MIVAGPHRSGGQKDAHVQGWLVSVLLHGTVALAAILIVKQTRLAPQDEPFKWNVAMVSPTQPVTPAASPPTQAQAPTAPSTTSAPSPHVQQTAPAQTPPSPQPLAQQTTPSTTERTVTPVVTEPPPPQPTTPIPSATHTTKPAEPIRHESAVPKVTEAPPIQEPTEAPTTVPVASDTHAAPSTSSAHTAPEPAQMTTISPAPSSTPSTTPKQATQSDASLADTAPAPTQMAAISPAPSNAPTKRDYGWLSEAILHRVEELKRYPAAARVDRAEGKVVVKAVINEDGSIGEVEIFQSSGYPSLDKAAMDTMQQAAPFHLPRPLGQARMTIKIPMSYRLDR